VTKPMWTKLDYGM